MNRQNKIIAIIRNLNSASISEIFEIINNEFSLSTLKREVSALVANGQIKFTGQGKSRKYSVNFVAEIFAPINLESYFEKEIDERNIRTSFNWELILEILPAVQLFTKEEISILEKLQNTYLKNKSLLAKEQFNRELERLAIDLSWKSSQIEGNTYSLLETEILLKEKLTAQGKPKDDAVMVLNHKIAIDFLIENKDYLQPLKISKIEDIHKLLINDLNIDWNIRRSRVGISGTNYQPLDNDYHIREAMEKACDLINLKTNIFEKALLVLLLISYIQPFGDGNKRTARIVSNAILMNNNHCPMSYRTVDSLTYKKAILLFYEQNNLTAFKKIFIDQYKFAVDTYF